MQALKMSMLAGVATGIGSLGLFMMLSSDGAAKEEDSDNEEDSKTNQIEEAKKQQAQKELDEEDASAIEVCKEMLIKELADGGNTPEYQTEETGDQRFLFTKAFVLKIVKFTHKYHSVIHHLMTKQAEDKRLAAIEADDDLDYAKAFYSQDILKMKTATEIEDIIFDHFSIIETQFEAASNFFKEDPTFGAAKTKIQEEVKQMMKEEYDIG